MKAKTAKTTHGRAPGKTQISISLPQYLVEKIDALAAADHRNRSNFIATVLERLADGTLLVTTLEQTTPARRRQ